MVTMSTIMASRFVAGIRAEVEKVEKQLHLFAETLDEWIAVQKAWMYLEPIFRYAIAPPASQTYQALLGYLIPKGLEPTVIRPCWHEQ